MFKTNVALTLFISIIYCYHLRGFSCLEFLVFLFKNVCISLCLVRDKIKEQSSKNITLIPTKTLLKKWSHSPINFQIFLSTYKLDSQNKNYIYKIKSQGFFFFFGYKINV